MKRANVWGLVIGSMLLLALVIAQSVVAQQEPTKPQCDVEAVIKHENEHTQELANFEEEAKTDLNAALATLYRTAIAYQALAAECGFANGAAVEAAHQLEHSGLFDADGDADHHEHSEEEEAAVLAMARSIGDPEQGKILFNAVRPEVSFACATCHRVDSTETLVGPGLLGISSHSHNHSEADTGTADSMAGMDMGEATAESGHDDHNSAGEAAEATDTPEQALAESVEFLRTSITNPSASVMTGFPDNLMPKVYGEIFTEQEINNLIAYLLTLD
jgi:hypothetical protein